MNCKLKCTNPSDIEYTISITATAKDFKLLRDEITDRFFVTQGLLKSISDLLIQANQTFTTEEC